MQIRQDLLAELPEGDRLRAHVYAAMGDALDRGEGKIAEEAACYEKSLEIVPNLYSLKISLLFISVIPNWVNRKNWLSKFGRKPGMPEYGLPPTSWDTIIRRRHGLICLKQ